MGVNASKENHSQSETEASEVDKELSSPKSVILVDPRSPSANIARTPIEVVTRLPRAVRICKNENSPTDVRNSFQPKNKHFDKVHRASKPCTPIRRPDFVDELDMLQKRKPLKKSALAQQPKLLESSPISHREEEVVPRTGYLETNLDFIDDNDEREEKSFVAEERGFDKITKAAAVNKEDNLKACLQQFSELDLERENETHSSENEEPPRNIISKQLSAAPSPITPLRDSNRVPLGSKNGNSLNIRSSGKPKSGGNSRIPLPKSASRKQLKVQCENTPPQAPMSRMPRPKRCQWDNERTLII